MSFPKRGKFFPTRSGAGDGLDGGAWPEISFAAEIAAALREDLGATRAAVKTLVDWTGANERTVKNWLAGRYGPSGVHLVGLMRRSDGVLTRVLDMAGRRTTFNVAEAARAERNLLAAVAFVRGLMTAREVSEPDPCGRGNARGEG